MIITKCRFKNVTNLNLFSNCVHTTCPVFLNVNYDNNYINAFVIINIYETIKVG